MCTATTADLFCFSLAIPYHEYIFPLSTNLHTYERVVFEQIVLIGTKERWKKNNNGENCVPNANLHFLLYTSIRYTVSWVNTAVIHGTVSDKTCLNET